MMAPSRSSALACLLLFAGSADAAVSADEIIKLPGWDGKLPSKHFSGYLDAHQGTKHMHYYLQLSEGDPATDPVRRAGLGRISRNLGWGPSWDPG